MSLASGCILHIVLLFCTKTSGESATTPEIDDSSLLSSPQPTPSATLPLTSSTPVQVQPSPTIATPAASIPITTSTTTTGLPSTSEMSSLYVIVLGATTGLFFVTTIISTLALVVMCCRRNRMPEKGDTADGMFTGAPVSLQCLGSSSHGPGVTGVKDLPVWSVGTFAHPNTTTTDAINNYQPEPVSPQNAGTAGPDTGKPAKSITPKRVAPPPPKNKKQRKAAAKLEKTAGGHDAEYAVPTTSRGHWFHKKRKEANSEYKELNLNQVEAPNPYAKPQVP